MKSIDLKTILPADANWLDDAPGNDIIISSRIRLARNLKDRAFPGWAGEQECVRIGQELHLAIAGTASMAGCHVLEMPDIDPSDREILRECHLLSNEMAGKGRGSSLVLRPDTVLGVMVNEEDHLRLQALQPGFHLDALWRLINDFDDELGAKVAYAVDARLGYLTACPTNVGTGMRASVMLHLPGLGLAKEIEPVIKGLNKIGLTARGLLGEGTEAIGNMFQISNQSTLGESEIDILHRLKAVIEELVEHENNARRRLFEQRPVFLRDFVGRAFGIAKYAALLTSREALDLLSALRLGSELGLVTNLPRPLLNRLTFFSQPAHLQQYLHRGLDIEERDGARAAFIRDEFEKSRVTLA